MNTNRSNSAVQPPKRTITGRSIKLPKGVTNIAAYEVLEIVLREALQNTPEELAVAMADAYRAGRGLQLVVRESKFGKGNQTALGWQVVDVTETAPGKWLIAPKVTITTETLPLQSWGNA